MPTNKLLIALTCGSVILYGCSSGTTENQVLPIDLSPPEVVLFEPGQNQAPTVLGSEADSEPNDDKLFDGDISWNLDGLTLEVVEPPIAGVTESQLVIQATNEDNTLKCFMQAQYLPDTVGITAQFTQFTRNLDITYISIDDFEAPNGPAKEYVSSFTQDDGVLVNTIGHFYYFPAEQLSYSDTSTFNLKCSTSANLYAANEARMRKIMNTIEFREVPELLNESNVDWSGFSSPMSDDFSRLRLRNQTDASANVFWLNFEGEYETLDVVAAGTSLSLDTFAGHLIVVSDLSNSVIGQFRMGEKDSLAVIR